MMDMEITAKDMYIGYLPLAHVLELIAESMMMVLGMYINNLDLWNIHALGIYCN